VTVVATTTVLRKKRSLVCAAGSLQESSAEQTGFVGPRVTSP